jgi:hypothetical protein
MRVVMRPYDNGRIEPPPALKSGFYPISRLELPLFLLGLS